MATVADRRYKACVLSFTLFKFPRNSPIEVRTPLAIPGKALLATLLGLLQTVIGYCQASAEPQPAPKSIEEVPYSEDYVLRSWGVDQGLPDSSVNALAQTSDGYLWVATNNGVARFDGVRFTQFSKKITPDFPSNRINSLLASREGDLWLGFGRGGVGRLKDNRFEIIYPERANTEPNVYTSSLLQDKSGAIWFAQSPDCRATRWFNGKSASFDRPNRPGRGIVPFLHLSGEGRVWFETRLWCGLFDGEKFQTYAAGGDTPGRLTPCSSGGTWAARNMNLIFIHEDGKVDIVADLTFLGGGPYITFLYEDRSGNLWIGTRAQGLVYFRDGKFFRVPTSHTSVHSMLEDYEGNLWVGTPGGGLDRIRRTRFRLHQPSHGLPREDIVSLSEDVEGRLWVAGRDGSVARALDSSNQRFGPVPGGIGGIVTLLADPQGGVWFGGYGGLSCWKSNEYRREAFHEPSTALLVDHKGDLWISSINGTLCRWRDGLRERRTKEEGLFEPRALYEDSQGCLWVGTERGALFRRINDKFEPIPLPGAGPGEVIRFLVPDGNDRVWIGAMEGGLYCWQKGGVTHLPHGAGLPDQDLRTMIVDSAGNYWFGTGGGLFFAKRDALEAAMDGTAKTLRVLHYGLNDGLPTLEFSLGFRNSAVKTRDGHLWFATLGGVLEVNPSRKEENASPKSLLIEEVRLGETLIPVSDHSKLVFEPKPAPLQFRYTLPEFSAPEQVHFRYRLVESGNGEWIEAGTERTARFSHLSAGDYCFQVEAADISGKWLPQTVSLLFTIRQAWWETAWFDAIAGLLGALGLTGLVRYVVKRRMRARMLRIEQEHALERERTRIARDIHDELGANLTQISFMSKLAKLNPPEEVFSHIDQISAVARGTVESLDEIVWAINPRCDHLAALIEYLGKYAANFLHASGIECHLNLPNDLPEVPLGSNVRHHLFLVVKETLNNAAKYAGATSVQLKVQWESRLLRIVVSDNGCGFDPDQVDSDGNGLKNMQTRLSEIGGTCTLETAPGKGTTVTFELAL